MGVQLSAQGAIIKTAYEAEADTNAYNDAAVTKLAGIETGADVTDSTNVAAAGAVMDSDFSGGEGFMRKTGAGAYEVIKSNMAAAVAPTVNEDSGDGYVVGSRWLDTTADKEYVCLDATVGAAVWIETTGAGGGGVTDHGALTGLADDDHSQYLLVDGTRAMTGDMNMGGKDITNVLALQASGTASQLDIHGGTGMGGGGKIGTFGKTHATALYRGDIRFYVPNAAGNTDMLVMTIDGLTDTPAVDIYYSLDMNSKKIENLLAGSAAADAVRYDQVLRRASADINSFAEKASPINADIVIIEDSAASYAKKKVQVGNLPSGGSGGDACYTLAATDTPATVKNRADGTCSATSAETEINTAFATYDTVKLTEGTFIVDGSITPGAGQSLIGSGANTVIKIKDAHNAYTEVIYIYNVANTLVSNLTLDGNRANQTSGDMYGIVWYTATHAIISNCWINNFRKDAMRARTDCKYGIVANCIFDNNDYGPSIESGSAYITVHDCVIRRSQYSGLYISSASHITFKNNIVLESSQITNNTWNDVKIEGGGGSDPVTDIDIQGNVIRAGEQTNKSKYAIEVNNSNCTRILIANNDCYGVGVTGTFLDVGTSTNWGAGNRKKDGTWATGS